MSVFFWRTAVTASKSRSPTKVLRLFLYRSCKCTRVLATRGKVVFVMATACEWKRVTQSVSFLPYLRWRSLIVISLSFVRASGLLPFVMMLGDCVEYLNWALRWRLRNVRRVIVACIFMARQLLTSSRVWWLCFVFVPIVLRLSRASDRIFRGRNWISHL